MNYKGQSLELNDYEYGYNNIRAQEACGIRWFFWYNNGFGHYDNLNSYIK